ncbi:hypothetical protein HAZT_HAZT000081 [Hyalella azteca]|uniref:ZP domain-containing protein n=1 Tax=Hyalella azteca TaxID=294128 RepID=A0A6A0H495_HYAAZ|nr:hypothetical protein HAZT_HAZT000081 [Hyalella azteca]
MQETTTGQFASVSSAMTSTTAGLQSSTQDISGTNLDSTSTDATMAETLPMFDDGDRRTDQSQEFKKKIWKDPSDFKKTRDQAVEHRRSSPVTESSTSLFSSTYSILTTASDTMTSPLGPASEIGSNSILDKKKEVKNNHKNETDRSALIRLPSRDGQVIFLADDPEAAAKIPGLLTKLHGQQISTSADIYLTGTASTSTSNFPSIRDVTAADVAFPTADFPTTLDDVRTGLGRTVHMPGHVASAVLQGREDKLNNEIGSARYHAGQPYRSSFPNRKPYRSPGNSEVRKEALDFPPSPFSRTRSDGAIARPALNMTRVTHIEAECQDDYMRIHTQFNGSFTGLIYSAGYAYDRECIYVNGSGRHLYDFHIQLNRCGTLGGNERGDLDVRGRPTQKNMMWNTLTVQYNPLIEEEWDEHFKVTCEYGYDFWKTVTFPFLDVEVQTGNPVVFTLTPPECHMEIRYGYGTTGNRITGPVRVGDPLTLVIYMRSELDEKLISHFEGTRSDDGHFETQVYAFMKTFRFTGSPALYIECDVRMCHGECPPQPCHWKRNSRDRRSVSSSSDAPSSGNVSESLNLFQALHVLRDDEPAAGLPLRAVTVLLGLLTAACLVLCLRARRVKNLQQIPQHPCVVPAYKSDFVPPSKRRLQ